MNKVNVLGFGVMGKQIVSLLSLLGYEVTVWSMNRPNLNELVLIKDKLRDRLKCNEKEILICECIEDLDDNLTIEALVENLDVKKSIYTQLKNKITKGYYTNTSSYSPREIGDEIGVLHFFNPIRMKFIEYLPSCADSKSKDLVCNLEDNGFLVARVKQNRCFIGNFILFHEFSAYFKLLEKYGYNYGELDKVMCKLYGDRDILKIMDIIGIDVTLKIMENIKEDEHEFFVPKLLKDAIDHKILGYKNKTSIKDFLSNIL